MSIEACFENLQPRIEAALERRLPREDVVPEAVHAAMRYSLFAGGKRLRPVLVALAHEAAGGTGDSFESAACAVEMVHTYSLIHDDLPAMDDDDLRRGKPTCHVVFGEAVAILAGDALLTRAFEILADEVEDPAVSRRLVKELALAAGSTGMVGGQILDLEAEGAPPDLDRVRTLAEKKTGALIRACLTMGVIAAGGPPEFVERLGRYGALIGLAFQVVDDLLDQCGTAEELGKTPGKDVISRKLTFPGVLGSTGARELATALIGEAKSMIQDCQGCEPLIELADFVHQRHT